MPSDAKYPGRGAGRSRLALLAVLLVVGLVGVGVGAWLLQGYDPFLFDRPDMKESGALRDAGINGPLTDAEFGRAVELLPTARPIAQMRLIALLQVEGSRTPARREPAIRALEALPESADEQVRQAARNTVGRLKNPPPADPQP